MEKNKPEPAAIEAGTVSPEQLQEIERGEYLTPKQLAATFGYTRSYISEFLNKGLIKGVKPFGGHWRIPKSELTRLREKGCPPMPREAKQTKPVKIINAGGSEIPQSPREAPNQEHGKGVEGVEGIDWEWEHDWLGLTARKKAIK